MPSLRKAAKGQPCMLRLYGCAPGPDNETVVLCHHRGAGGALKSDDYHAAVLGCYNCHVALDGPESDLPDTYDNVFNKALDRTQAHWRRLGLR